MSAKIQDKRETDDDEGWRLVSCPHHVVRRMTAGNADGSIAEWWACSGCEVRFRPELAPRRRSVGVSDESTVSVEEMIELGRDDRKNARRRVR